ncbi:hypothetical protein V2J09_019321 [Rumex salicifolius]
MMMMTTMSLGGIRCRGISCWVQLVLILSLTHSCSSGGRINNNCPTESTYSSSTAYLQNLNRLFINMTSESSKTGFYEHSEGTGSDQVYGSYLCQGRLPAANCSQCVTEASNGIQTTCLNKVGASAWYDECTLKYSNHNFSGQLIHNDSLTWCSSGVNFNSSGPELDMVLYGTLTQVAKRAAVNQTKFATMEADLTFLHDTHTTLYTSAQCMPDLSNDSCLQCLSQSITIDLPTYCNGTVGGRTICSSCTIRYDVGRFYTSDQVDITVNTTSPPAALPPVPPLEVHKRKWLYLSLGILIPAAVMLLILGMWCYVRYCKRLNEFEGIDMEEITAADSFQMDFYKVRAATLNFSPDNKLGEGGFGDVFKAWRLWNENAELEMVDSALNDAYSMEEVVKCIHIGLLCIQENAGKRPKMSSVVAALNGESVYLPEPTPPNFFDVSRSVLVTSGSTSATTTTTTTTGNPQSSFLLIPVDE